MSSNQTIRWVVKPSVFLAALGPLVWLVWAGLAGQLSADPLADLTNETGVWTLRFLCLSLTVTPVRRLTSWNSAIRFRRMFGLFAFFYGSLHLLTYVGADRFKRPFITVGVTAWLTLLPLALTSTAWMIRRLGGRRWQRLHRLAYAAAVLAVLHYWWLVKADVRRPEAYALVVGCLLAARLWWAWARKPIVAARVARVA